MTWPIKSKIEDTLFSVTDRDEYDQHTLWKIYGSLLCEPYMVHILITDKVRFKTEGDQEVKTIRLSDRVPIDIYYRNARTIAESITIDDDQHK